MYTRKFMIRLHRVVLFLVITAGLILCNQERLQAQTQPSMEPISEGALDQDDLNQAQYLSEQILGKMAAGSFYPLSEEEAIPQLSQIFTEDFQKEAYTQISSQVGDYMSSINFVQAFDVRFGGFEGIVYRFRGKFSKSEPEVRVTMTRDHKLAGIQVLPWNDQMLQR